MSDIDLDAIEFRLGQCVHEGDWGDLAEAHIEPLIAEVRRLRAREAALITAGSAMDVMLTRRGFESRFQDAWRTLVGGTE